MFLNTVVLLFYLYFDYMTVSITDTMVLSVILCMQLAERHEN